MRRTTVSIPTELLVRAQRVAATRGVSLGEVCRDALQTYLDGATAWDPPMSIGAADSGGAMTGEQMGELPEEAFGPRPA